MHGSQSTVQHSVTQVETPIVNIAERARGVVALRDVQASVARRHSLAGEAASSPAALAERASRHDGGADRHLPSDFASATVTS